MRQWTAEERARQAQLIHYWKPWRFGGVKTPEGKQISKMNALKHGGYDTKSRAACRLVAKYRRGLLIL